MIYYYSITHRINNALSILSTSQVNSITYEKLEDENTSLSSKMKMLAEIYKVESDIELVKMDYDNIYRILYTLYNDTSMLGVNKIKKAKSDLLEIKKDNNKLYSVLQNFNTTSE